MAGVKRATRRRGVTPIPLEFCSVCGWTLDRATPAKGRRYPRPGDFSVCLNCGHPTTFGPDMHRQDFTPAQWAALDLSERKAIQRAQNIVAQRAIKFPDGRTMH